MQSPLVAGPHAGDSSSTSRALPSSGRRRAVKRLPGRSRRHVKKEEWELKPLRSKTELLQDVLVQKAPIGRPFGPLDSFPIPTTPCVARMAQYYCQVWGPQHGAAFGFEGHPQPYLSLLWPFALQSDIVFEGLISLCRATFLAIQGQSASADPSFARHRANVVSRLRARLEDPRRCADDATLLTVACLGTVDYVLGDHTAAAAHVTGMRQMMRIRGDIRPTTPWDRFLVSNLAAYEALWSFLFAVNPPATHHVTAGSQRHAGRLVQNAELPIYMSHPFKPDVCAMLAKLPQGFCDLGLTGRLSRQMIRLLHDVTALRRQFADCPVDDRLESALRPQIQGTFEDLHRLATLQTTVTDRFLVHGLIAYLFMLLVVHFHDVLDVIFGPALKALADVALRQPPTSTTPDRGCYIWTITMISTALHSAGSLPAEWTALMRQFFDNYPEARRWNTLQTACKTFFWEDPLQNPVRTAYDAAAAKKVQQTRAEREDRSRTTMAIRNVLL